MKFAVMGAGAVDSYFGGTLARAGCAVGQIDRQLRLQRAVRHRAAALRPPAARRGHRRRDARRDARRVVRDVAEECLAVAHAARVRVDGDRWEALRRTGSQAGQVSSMAQDLARGRRTEIEHLNGYVVRMGEAHGVPTPVNRCLQVLVNLLQSRRAVASAGAAAL